jgi:hypothetical protein
MRCSGCGKPLISSVTVCLHCGTPITNIPQQATALIIDLPEMPDPVPQSGDNWPSLAPVTGPYGSYAPVNPPPPPLFLHDTIGANLYDTTPVPKSGFRRRIFISLFVVCSLIFIGVGTSYALAKLRQGVSSEGGGISKSQPFCTLLDVDPSVSGLISDLQTTSKLRNEAQKDYEPVDNTTRFTVGQTVYATFIIRTDEEITLVSNWCMGATGKNRPSFTLHVSKKSQGFRAYFSLEKTTEDALGTSLLTITTDNKVVARLAFTMIR